MFGAPACFAACARYPNPQPTFPRMEPRACAPSSPAGPGSSARTSASGSWPKGTRSSPSITSSPATSRNLDHLRTNPRFRFIGHDISNPLKVEGHDRQRPALRQPGQPGRLPRTPDPDAQGRLARHAQHARPRQGPRRPLPARQHQRGLRRPARTPADGELLGQRQPHRRSAACTTRRSGSPSRSPWPTTAPTGSIRRSSASSTPTASGCGSNDGRVLPNFMCQALMRRTAHRLRRRQADAELLLRRPTWSKASSGCWTPTTTTR